MLSLIVTFYDETAFLRTALRSARNQGIDTLEIILVNDNPDVFSDVDLKTLTDGFDVRILHHEQNKGLSAARNTGIAAATGDHIVFLDADDYFTAGGLARHYAYALETQADITQAACYLGFEGSVNGRVLMRDKALHMQRRVVNGTLTAQEAQFIVSSWSSIYRKAFLDENDLRFDDAQRKFEDRLFVLNVVTAAKRIAFLGEPVRLWRRRANSISSARPTVETLALQVQLLEKCMAHMKSETQRRNLPARFEKRELFNTVSRLIWDMEIIAPLAQGDPEVAELGPRIQALLGDESFGHAIFDDAMVRAISRVGQKTRRGRITRSDFFTLHKALRDGDFQRAHDLLRLRAAALPVPTRPVRHPGKRLVLHIGLHKTASTFLQHHFRHYRSQLRAQGILFPYSGFDDTAGGRDGALAGHQGLVRALRQNDEAMWAALHREISESTAQTVLISAENMGFPTEPERDALIAQLFARLGQFDQRDVLALVRRPDTYAEAFYAEWVVGAQPGGARSIHEFLVDHGATLTDLPTLFAPFEDATGQAVTLLDFDALRDAQGLWTGVRDNLGLAQNLPELDLPRYATPDRTSLLLMQLINTTVSDRSKRQRIMNTFFQAPQTGDAGRLLAPSDRLALLSRFEDMSQAFAFERGYRPDLDAYRNALKTEIWTPPTQLPTSQLQALLDVSAQIAAESEPHVSPATSKPRKSTGITIRPRPWVMRLLERVKLYRPD